MQEKWKTWIAALIDGEGSLSFNKSHFKPHYTTRPSRRGFSWQPRVHVWNNSKALLEHLLHITGLGYVVLRDYKYIHRQNDKPGYDWQLKNEEARELLPQIQNYLIAKKAHCKLLLEALEIMKMYQSLGPVEDITIVRDKRLEAIYWELRLLNNRGINGEKQVLELISQLPSDPRLYTRERFEVEIKQVKQAHDERALETRRRAARNYKARNREKMHAYYKQWYQKKTVNDAAIFDTEDSGFMRRSISPNINKELCEVCRLNTAVDEIDFGEWRGKKVCDTCKRNCVAASEAAV